jgi:hypothetical protein
VRNRNEGLTLPADTIRDLERIADEMELRAELPF